MIKGKSVTHTFTSQSKALQELNAEWIVEDFESGGALVPFANFGTVTFTGATATTGSYPEISDYFIWLNFPFSFTLIAYCILSFLTWSSHRLFQIASHQELEVVNKIRIKC